MVGEGGCLQKQKSLNHFAGAILLVVCQSALATQPMFASCMPFVPVCVQGFNNNTNPLALAVEFAHTMHQHTHAPHRPRPAGPTALGSGGGGVGGVMGDWHTGIRGWGGGRLGLCAEGGWGWKCGRKWPRVFIYCRPSQGDMRRC